MRLTKKLFNMILENLSTWLPISFRLIKFPLGFSFVDLGSLFLGTSRRNHKLKVAPTEKSKPNFMFCFEMDQGIVNCKIPDPLIARGIVGYDYSIVKTDSAQR